MSGMGHESEGGEATPGHEQEYARRALGFLLYPGEVFEDRVAVCEEVTPAVVYVHASAWRMT